MVFHGKWYDEVSPGERFGTRLTVTETHLVLGSGLSLALAHPAEISYFNFLAGGPEGGARWLSDWFVRRFGVRNGFFTPPFSTFDDLAEQFNGFTIGQDLAGEVFSPGKSLLAGFSRRDGFRNLSNPHQALPNLRSEQQIHRRFANLDDRAGRRSKLRVDRRPPVDQ